MFFTHVGLISQLISLRWFLLGHRARAELSQCRLMHLL